MGNFTNPRNWKVKLAILKTKFRMSVLFFFLNYTSQNHEGIKAQPEQIIQKRKLIGYNY